MSDTTKKPASELVADSIKALTEQLQAGNSAALTAHLATMGKFHRYSFGNIMAIAFQLPDATRVAGFQTWKTLGRNVKKGEHAIRILAPLVRKNRDAAAGESESSVYGFRSVCVFDISQTEGAELPQFASVSGEPGDTVEKLLQFAAAQSITVELNQEIGSALGVSYGGRIALAPDQSPAGLVAVLVHELGHELLHKGEARKSSNASKRELEAEAVAFVVCSSIGFDMSTHSADYIKLYDGDAEALGESLGAVCRASTLILKALDAAATESEVAA
jgi:antirestriction protein ArdC